MAPSWTLVLLGFFSLGIAAVNAPVACSAELAFGTFLPGLLLAISGLLVRRRETEPKTKRWILLPCGLLTLVFAAATGAGCSRRHPEEKVKNAAEAKEKLPDEEVLRPNPEEKETAWTHESREFGFRVTLPSRDWKSGRRPGMHAAFHHPGHSIITTLQAKKETKANYLEKSVKELREYIENTPDDFIGKLNLAEGETRAGDPCTAWTGLSKADNGDVFFVGFGLIWCKNKSLTIKMVFEGTLKKRSPAEKAEEETHLKTAFETIFQSIR